MSQRHPALYIAPSDLHGRGVFAAEAISEGEIIEICPVIVMPADQRDLIHNTDLHDYYFLWGENEQEIGIILGYGSIYNHAATPNAEYYPDYSADTLSIFCLKDIAPGEEITLNYNGNPDDQSAVWFEKK